MERQESKQVTQPALRVGEQLPREPTVEELPAAADRVELADSREVGCIRARKICL